MQMKRKKPHPDYCPTCISPEGECFARRNGKCTVLVDTKRIRQCNYKKAERLVTNGTRYPDEAGYQNRE